MSTRTVLDRLIEIIDTGHDISVQQATEKIANIVSKEPESYFTVLQKIFPYLYHDNPHTCESASLVIEAVLRNAPILPPEKNPPSRYSVTKEEEKEEEEEEEEEVKEIDNLDDVDFSADKFMEWDKEEKYFLDEGDSSGIQLDDYDSLKEILNVDDEFDLSYIDTPEFRDSTKLFFKSIQKQQQEDENENDEEMEEEEASKKLSKAELRKLKRQQRLADSGNVDSEFKREPTIETKTSQDGSLSLVQLARDVIGTQKRTDTSSDFFTISAADHVFDLVTQISASKYPQLVRLGIFSPCCRGRNGALLAIRAVLRTVSNFLGYYGSSLKNVNNNALYHSKRLSKLVKFLLLLIARDRYVDFDYTLMSAPIVDMTGQILAILLPQLNTKLQTSVFHKLMELIELYCGDNAVKNGNNSSFWKQAYAGLIPLRYILSKDEENKVPFEMDSEQTYFVFNMLKNSLGCRQDDVLAIGILIVEQILDKLTNEHFNELKQLYWECFDLSDDSPAFASIIHVFPAIYDPKRAVSSDLNMTNEKIKGILKCLNHEDAIVRFETLTSLITLTKFSTWQTNHSISLIEPLYNACITQFDATETLLRKFMISMYYLVNRTTDTIELGTFKNYEWGTISFSSMNEFCQKILIQQFTFARFQSNTFKLLRRKSYFRKFINILFSCAFGVGILFRNFKGVTNFERKEINDFLMNFLRGYRESVMGMSSIRSRLLLSLELLFMLLKVTNLQDADEQTYEHFFIENDNEEEQEEDDDFLDGHSNLKKKAKNTARFSTTESESIDKLDRNRLRSQLKFKVMYSGESSGVYQLMQRNDCQMFIDILKKQLNKPFDPFKFEETKVLFADTKYNLINSLNSCDEINEIEALKIQYSRSDDAPNMLKVAEKLLELYRSGRVKSTQENSHWTQFGVLIKDAKQSYEDFLGDAGLVKFFETLLVMNASGLESNIKSNLDENLSLDHFYVALKRFKDWYFLFPFFGQIAIKLQHQSKFNYEQVAAYSHLPSVQAILQNICRHFTSLNRFHELTTFHTYIFNEQTDLETYGRSCRFLWSIAPELPDSFFDRLMPQIMIMLDTAILSYEHTLQFIPMICALAARFGITLLNTFMEKCIELILNDFARESPVILQQYFDHVFIDAIDFDLDGQIYSEIDMRTVPTTVFSIFCTLIRMFSDNSIQDLPRYSPILVRPLMMYNSSQNEIIKRLAYRLFSEVVRVVAAYVGISDSHSIANAPVGASEKLNNMFKKEAKILGSLLNPSLLAQKPLKLLFDFNTPVTLRNYQVEGIKWLDFLRGFGMSGALCDDMGLGKTLQALSIVAHTHTLYQTRQKINTLSLVLCPSSLVVHWERETARFVGNAIVPVCISGTPAERKEFIADVKQQLKRARQSKGKSQYNVSFLLIASYNTIRNCRHLDDFIKKENLTYLLLDEGHQVRDPTKSLFKKITTIKSKFRLILSGTPIQNNVLDLWSLFEILMPGFLGTRTYFRKKYAKPVEKHQQLSRQAKSAATSRSSLQFRRKLEIATFESDKARTALENKVLPFILRRLKSQVLSELPPKMQIVRTFELTDIQRKIYKLTLEETPKQELQFMRLTKVVTHPCLMANDNYIGETLRTSKEFVGYDAPNASGKLQALQMLLTECGIIVTDNFVFDEELNRALIFAEYKSSLDLVVKYVLEPNNVSYLRIDGDVIERERQNIVDQFNSGEADVLLLTKKVGSHGLNLTGANVIILLELSYNPAVDLQAMDRAHRIGQKRQVIVYTLIGRGTVQEEKLDTQYYKMDLAESIVNAKNEGLDTMDTGGIVDRFG
eukprot:TRINITY_DN3149_c6_g8_i1.p1 TRINITY_DN3149_c6_g8~~TRINITY_DN3149_c6_g8_i1.p1  ORF type:complete len:1799 (-),score=428.36 TRINITY_DN3149_c6_g8_i1:49-5445(-)